MHDWNYTPDHPISLSLSADARLGPTDYLNDQIWELNLGNSEPPAISFQTTYGLRARFCRIFPRFIRNGKVAIDPAHFHQPITIHQYFPNYLRLSCKPFWSINAIIDYWVPDSHTIAARMKVTNTSHETCQMQVDWAESLVPTIEGIRMATQEIGVTTILTGETADLVPVFLLTGGIQTGKSPYPSLTVVFRLPSHGEHISQWVQASLTDLNSSYEQAKSILSKNWNVEFSRVLRVNSQRMEIITGNQDWNTAIYMTQTKADQLILQPTDKTLSSSFVSQRNPDQGFSLLKNGSDYGHLWNGQSVMETYYLTNFLLPTAPDILKGILDNYFNTQSAKGEIDLKPGLGGQRSHVLATPLLSCLTWRLYRYTSDRNYINKVFPKLLSFFLTWFTKTHDRDEDLIPEWDQLIQTGFETNPHFSDINNESMGMVISTVESPDLCAFLFQECQSLLLIAKEINDTEAIPRLVIIAEKLKGEVDEFWNDQQACFIFRDRDTHSALASEFLCSRKGTGIIEINQEYQPSIRPVIQVRTTKEGTHPIHIYIHGTLASGNHRVDHIQSSQFHWQLDCGCFTSQNIYQAIEHIEVLGASPNDTVCVLSSGYICADITGLIPLWAGLVTEDKAKILVNLGIMNKKKFLSPYGLRPCCDLQGMEKLPDEFCRIYWLWIAIILEGLLLYGENKKAAVIITRLIKNVINYMKQNFSFHQFYHSETGIPLGPINTLTSLIPIGLFLEVVGVKIISPTKVEIKANNPFPWPVSIKYRGLTVVHQKKKTLVLFPDGRNITLDNNHHQIVSLD